MPGLDPGGDTGINSSLGSKSWDLWLGKASTLDCCEREALGGSRRLLGFPTWGIAFPCVSQAFSSFHSPPTGISAWMAGVLWWDLPVQQGELLRVRSPKARQDWRLHPGLGAIQAGIQRAEGLCLSVCSTTEAFAKSWGIQGSGRVDDEVIPCLSCVPFYSPPHSIPIYPLSKGSVAHPDAQKPPAITGAAQGVASGVIRVQIKAQLLTGLQASSLPHALVPSPQPRSPRNC